MLHRRLPLHRQAGGVRVWVEVEDRAHKQGTFLLSRLLAKIWFNSSASHSFIAASAVRELGLKVETLEEPLYVSFPLETRVSIDLICRGCELEISGILLTVHGL